MRTALFVLFCALAALPLAAASRIAGVVVDASGAPIPNATVVVGGRSVTTGDDGKFEIADGPDGETTVVVSAPGFAATTLRLTGGGDETRVTLRPAQLLEAVVVTASRGAERLSSASAATVVTSAELLNSAGGALDDILRNTPGFSLFRRSSSRVSNPTTQGVTLRGVSGSGSSRTMVLSDGLPLNDPFGSWVYWNRVPEAAIERVEVLRGATGDLYGADALGGVVQVLTFPSDRTRLRFSGEGGSFDTGRGSLFGSTRRGSWEAIGAAELQRTDGVIVVGEEARGPVDVPANSDYTTGFFGGGYAPGTWHASFRVNMYDENRGNGTPLTVNTTDWTQVSGEAGGTAANGAWLVRASVGSQEYYQTFSAVAANRQTERLTREQTMPTDFATIAGQWSRGLGGSTTLLVGGDYHRTASKVDETNYAVNGSVTHPPQTGGDEDNGAVFGRVSFAPSDAVTVVVGGRGDFWRSNPRIETLAEHNVNFFSPRASTSWRISNAVSLHGSLYRGYRTPTLNELHRGFSVGNTITNPNPELDPERLTGFEGGVLLTRGIVSTRVTGFWNQLEDAVTNVTITAPGVTPILRQRQNTDKVRARGLEVETDLRPFDRWLFSGVVVLTDSEFAESPKQPQLEGNQTPQVPTYQLGATMTYTDPRGFTGSVQARGFGKQYDDDLNLFPLAGYAVVDLSLSQELHRGINVFLAVENLFDEDYDTGKTPIRTIGWPRSARVGVRLFLP